MKDKKLTAHTNFMEEDEEESITKFFGLTEDSKNDSKKESAQSREIIFSPEDRYPEIPAVTDTNTANKNCDDMFDDEIRFISCDMDRPQGHFCQAFAASCPHFENTGFCKRGDCVHADKRNLSEDEMLRQQLLEIRRTQLEMVTVLRAINVPRYKPKTR